MHLLSLWSKQNTRNKSAEFLENRNKSASVQVPQKQIRERKQIRCDTALVASLCCMKIGYLRTKL